MTDMEMDLMMAKAEVLALQKVVREQADKLANSRTHIASLQAVIDDLRKQKCNFNGLTIKPDGVNDLDPCDYELMERHRNVSVEVLRCKKCGHIEILWQRQEDTEDGDFDG